MRQAGSSDQKANEFTAQATEERKNEKENDAIVQENLKKWTRCRKKGNRAYRTEKLTTL